MTEEEKQSADSADCFSLLPEEEVVRRWVAWHLADDRNKHWDKPVDNLGSSLSPGYPVAVLLNRLAPSACNTRALKDLLVGILGGITPSTSSDAS